jgi:hypothetical protein
MKPNKVYTLAARYQDGGVFHSKLFVAALLLALLFASFSAVSALAAPASDEGITEDKINTEEINEEEGWQAKLNHLRWAGFYYDHVQFFPADFEDREDLARVHELLEKYGVALRAANTIVQNHAGFDIEGNVLNERQAAKSVRDLAMYLQIMRGLQAKISEIPHDSHPLRAGL